MKIDKENYEAWMLDYLEGKLSGKQLALFEQFLSEHPELREEAEGIEKLHLEPSERFFEDKAILKAKMLKQVIDEEELTTFEAAEGTLDGDKRERLDKRMATSGRLANKLQNYKEARLTADESIVFTNKDALRRQEVVVMAERSERALWPYMIAAAVMAGVVYFAIPEDQVQRPDRRPMAELVKSGELKSKVSKTTTTKSIDSSTIAPLTPAVKPVSQPPLEAVPVQNVAKVTKVIDPGARIKHEALTAPSQDFAARTARKIKPVSKSVKRAVVKEEPPIVKEPLIYQSEIMQQIAQAPKERVQPKPYQRSAAPAKPAARNGVKGTGNSNFVMTPDAEQLAAMESAENKKKLFSAGTRLLARVSGDRLKIENKQNNKVEVKFESQLLGFSKTF